jgi:ComF family protein
MNWQKIRRYILHIFYPNRCPVCGKIIGYDDFFCEECTANLVFFEEDFHIPQADRFCAAFIYDGNISPAVILLKDGICGNSDYAMGKYLTDRLVLIPDIDEYDLIIPVPLHKSRKRERTYNQCELIGREVSRRTGIPLCTDAVIKVKKTKSQKNLTGAERRVNLKDAFAVSRPEIIKDKNIILLDDVCTTGSTMHEITSLMKKNGAAKICCASCCKTSSLA